MMIYMSMILCGEPMASLIELFVVGNHRLTT